jgi:hypothetical protein
MNSSVGSHSMQDFFDSIVRNQVEPSYKIFFRYREIVFCYIAVTVSMILVVFQEGILLLNFSQGKYYCVLTNG